MELTLFKKINDFEWQIPQKNSMRVPAVIFAAEELIREMDLKVHDQLCNVATLPGIVSAAYGMPDAHWGYGFPIGGVAAFDAKQGGVISAGGVGFDISCGVRLLTTGLQRSEIDSLKHQLADALYAGIPAGVGSTSRIRLDRKSMDDMLQGGARWAVENGYGDAADLERIEEQGCMAMAMPQHVSDHAKERQREEMGTLGSGNHYLEVQEVIDIYDQKIATAFGLAKNALVISIHCGSRGLGHQIGTDYMRLMLQEAANYNIQLPDRELACAPINSDVGEKYLGAMRAGINCALANREILTHFVRQIFKKILPTAHIQVMYDVSHNTCKEEQHLINGDLKQVYIHRKGATRAFGPGHSQLPKVFKDVGQPVIIGGSMGTSSYVLAGTEQGEKRSFSSSCHGAGRAMSRHEALKRWRGRELIDQLADQGIIIRSTSYRGVAEEAPGAYKNVDAVIEAAHNAGISKKVARLKPLICIKG